MVHLGTAWLRYTALKNIYPVSSTFIVSLAVKVSCDGQTTLGGAYSVLPRLLVRNYVTPAQCHQHSRNSPVSFAVYKFGGTRQGLPQRLPAPLPTNHSQQKYDGRLSHPRDGRGLHTMTQNSYTRSLPTSGFVARFRALVMVERQSSHTSQWKDNSS